MISGRQALTQIVSAERQQQGALQGLDQKLEGLGRELMALEQRRADDYAALARVRVDLVDDGTLSSALDAAERQVAAVLEQRRQAAATLQRELDDAKALREALSAEREAQADRLDQAGERLDEAEAATQARLGADPDYQAQRAHAREAERVAMHAEEKATDSEQEQDAKGAAYRADPLFIYLWNRHFGTPKYDAGGLARWLDGKVARLIGYHDARMNYARLLEIPQRLREYASAARQQSDDAFAALRALDEAAREADGVLTLEQARDAEQERIEDIDARIGEAEASINDLLEHQARFASGDDDYTRKAVDFLAAELERDDLAELRRVAQATPFPDDDQIVNRLQQAEQERRRLNFTIENLKQTRAKQQQKLDDLARLQRDFKRQRMDRTGSGFADGNMVAMMLGNFINGMLDREALMDVLEQQQRQQPQRSNPSFGSGGFGRGTPWGGSHGGFGGLRRGGRISSGGSRGSSSGGFRTGGGF
jgi:chromosome segregation ATPase